jgi:hypothetical protein
MSIDLSTLSPKLCFDTDEIYCQESTLNFVKFVMKIQFLFTLIQYNAGSSLRDVAYDQTIFLPLNDK